MSAKNKDDKNRWRNVTLGFRMSPEENAELEVKRRLTGYGTRGEFIRQSILNQKIVAMENPLMITTFRRELQSIESALSGLDNANEIEEEWLTPIRTMLEIMQAFDELRKEKKTDEDEKI